MHTVQSQSDATRLVEVILSSKSDFMAVDTEFVRQKTFWPELCLIQVFIDGACYVVDCLHENVNVNGIVQALYQNQKTWVLHASKQDLEIFFHMRKELPEHIFDTQIAAAFLGFGESVSYDALVQHYLGHTLDKSLQHTNWARRPLSYDMLTYAGRDVLYLGEFYKTIVKDLEDKGRFAWAMDEMKLLSNAAQFFDISPGRLKRLDISKKDYALAKKIFRFRDEHAAKLNLNRGSVFHDKMIQTILNYKEIEKMRAVLVKSSPTLVHHDLIPELLKLIEEGREEVYTPPLPPTREQDLEMARVKMMRDELAKKYDFSPSFLASNEDIKAFVMGTESKISRTWRRELFIG